VAGLFQFSPARLASLLTPRQGVRREAGLEYGPLPRQRLDIYTPENLAPEAPAVPLYNNLGAHHYRISTADSLVQRYFDQAALIVKLQ
jgi:hypothetical protein